AVGSAVGSSWWRAGRQRRCARHMSTASGAWRSGLSLTCAGRGCRYGCWWWHASWTTYGQHLAGHVPLAGLRWACASPRPSLTFGSSAAISGREESGWRVWRGWEGGLGVGLRGRGLGDGGMLMATQRHISRGATCLQAGIALGREADDWRALNSGLQFWGAVLRVTGHPEQAVACFEEVLALGR